VHLLGPSARTHNIIDHDETFQAYSSFTTNSKPPDQYEGLLVQASKIRAQAVKAYQRREPYESSLVRILIRDMKYVIRHMYRYKPVIHSRAMLTILSMRERARIRILFCCQPSMNELSLKLQSGDLLGTQLRQLQLLRSGWSIWTLSAPMTMTTKFGRRSLNVLRAAYQHQAKSGHDTFASW
jgi:hypothetical protein